MKNRVALCVVLFGLAWNLGFAQKASAETFPGHRISYEELQARCRSPRDFDIAIEPQGIVLQCTRQRKEWTGDSGGGRRFVEETRMISSVFSNKYSVQSEMREIPGEAIPSGCRHLKELEDTITVELWLTCFDVMRLSDPNRYCESVLERMDAHPNPKLENRYETGRSLDTCSGSSN